MSSTDLISLPTGVSLQVHVSSPSRTSSTDRNKLAICLHPWSWLGGNMNDPVLQSLEQSLREKSYHILRFNSRGVGKSTGWASFSGMSEADDLRALVDWAITNIPGLELLVFIGYSHGSLIASLHLPLKAPIRTCHVLLSYPLGPRGPLTMFHTSTYASALQDLVRNPSAEVLIVYGDEDEFTAAGKYDTWSKELEKISDGGRLQIVKVEGGTHFWRGTQSKEMQGAIDAWLP